LFLDKGGKNMKRIIYPQENGTLAIVIPNTACGLTVEQIAQKDVPANVPYKIVDTADILEDRTLREAWEADFSEPDGSGKGGLQ
jgi:hypothetical protein